MHGISPGGTPHVYKTRGVPGCGDTPTTPPLPHLLGGVLGAGPRPADTITPGYSQWRVTKLKILPTTLNQRGDGWVTKKLRLYETLEHSYRSQLCGVYEVEICACTRIFHPETRAHPAPGKLSVAGRLTLLKAMLQVSINRLSCSLSWRSQRRSRPR